MSHDEFAFERFVKVLEEVFQKYGFEVLDKIEELEEKDRVGKKSE